MKAADAAGIRVTAVRMGQVCGPRATGAWGTREWFPSMVKSSIALGCLPKLSSVRTVSVSFVLSTDIAR